MKNYCISIILFYSLVLLAGASGCIKFDGTVLIKNYADIPRPPGIRSDYGGTVIPPNIAPLNFIITEPGTQYFVRIYSMQGEDIEISSKRPQIVIPPDQWRALLDANRGGKLYFEVYVMVEDDSWKRYQAIVNTIADEEIDSYLVYRLINPIHSYWRNIGIYQRNLENYDQSEVLRGRSFDRGCLNCHTFLNNNTENMFIGIRSAAYGSSAILAQGGKAVKIGTKLGYTAWHPSGRLAMYSINKVRQFFHASGPQVRDVIDLASALAYYEVETRAVKTITAISNKERLETYPTWSPDGRHLYFCSAPVLWEEHNKMPPDRYKDVKYSLMRISYDLENDKWVEPETVLSSDETGLSILLPRISPDGRFLLFCMCEYGCFPIYQQSSDLYLMNLETRGYRKLEINSDQPESWHSWSSNSRWIVFSSKRRAWPLTKSYISYVDEAGKVYKPFVLPQKDPAFYDSFLKTFSVPELVTAPVMVRQMELARAVRSPEQIEVDLPITTATPKAEKAPGADAWFQARE